MQVDSITRERLTHDRHAKPQCAEVGHRPRGADFECDVRPDERGKWINDPAAEFISAGNRAGERYLAVDLECGSPITGPRTPSCRNSAPVVLHVLNAIERARPDSS